MREDKENIMWKITDKTAQLRHGSFVENPFELIPIMQNNARGSHVRLKINTAFVPPPRHSFFRRPFPILLSNSEPSTINAFETAANGISRKN